MNGCGGSGGKGWKVEGGGWRVEDGKILRLTYGVRWTAWVGLILTLARLLPVIMCGLVSWFPAPQQRMTGV